MDADTTEFLAQFTPRLATALAEAITHDAADLDSPLIAAAITTADANLSFAFVACTRARQQEIQAMYTELLPELVADGDNSWWPDEWGFELEGPGGATDGSLTQLRSEWNAFHDRQTEKAQAEGTFDEFRAEWDERSLAALIAALDAPEVRSAFDEIGSNPVLVVTETDGGKDKAWGAFQILNADRDDDDFHAGADYWRP